MPELTDIQPEFWWGLFAGVVICVGLFLAARFSVWQKENLRVMARKHTQRQGSDDPESST